MKALGAKTNALKKAMGGFADKVTGTRRIDNAADPTSALSMLRRKAASRSEPTNFPSKLSN